MWPVLPPKAMQMSVVCEPEAILMSMDHAAAGDHIGIWSVLPQRPCGCPPSVLPPETTLRSVACADARDLWMSVVHAVARNCVQGLCSH